MRVWLWAAGTGEEFARQMFENPPLRRARILRFVNENMIDAGIELVEHPARIGALEERERAIDEIVEIQFSALRFRSFVTGEDRCGECRQRDRLFETCGGLCAARAGGPVFPALVKVHRRDPGACRAGVFVTSVFRGSPFCVKKIPK